MEEGEDIKRFSEDSPISINGRHQENHSTNGPPTTISTSPATPIAVYSSSSARKKFPNNLLNRKTRNWYQCRRCRYHGQFVFLAGGHYQVCPFRNCTCQACRYVSKDTERAGQRMREWRKHKKVSERQLPIKPQHPRIPAPGHPSVSSPTPSELAAENLEQREKMSLSSPISGGIGGIVGGVFSTLASQNHGAIPIVTSAMTSLSKQYYSVPTATATASIGLPLNLLSPGDTPTSEHRGFLPILPQSAAAALATRQLMVQNFLASQPLLGRPPVLQGVVPSTTSASIPLLSPLHLPTLLRPTVDDKFHFPVSANGCASPTMTGSHESRGALPAITRSPTPDGELHISDSTNGASSDDEPTNGSGKGRHSGDGATRPGVITSGATASFELANGTCLNQLMKLSQEVGGCSFTFRSNGEIVLQSESEDRRLRLVDLGHVIRITIEGQNGKRSDSEWPKLGGWDPFLTFVHTLLFTLCHICSAANSAL